MIETPRALLLALSVAVACAPPTPSSAPARPAAAPRENAEPLEGTWFLTPASRESAHRLEVVAELRSRVDTIERVDSLYSALEVAGSRVTSGAGARLSGLITHYRAGGSDSLATVPPGLTLPQPFSAEFSASGTQPRFVQPRDGECSVSAIAAQGIRDLWVTPPARLATGVLWTDEARFVVCRDSIPLTVSMRRRYRVVGAEQRDSIVAVLVERESETTLVGEGTQFGERITLEGEGRAVMHLALSLAGGVVIEGDGEGTLTLRLKGRRRSQELRQTTRTTIRPR